MCDIGFCVAKIIRGNEQDMGMACLEACSFNLKQQANSVKTVETVKEKGNFMFNESIVKGKRKRD